MDFTREPIIETVITPKEGCKLVIRSSKGAGQEEFFVDAVEVVSFGGTFFFRSLERPKAFLVPVSDYEVLEVRETRMVLKNVGMDRSIRIGGGKEKGKAKGEASVKEAAKVETEVKVEQEPAPETKKREKRRHFRRRRGRERVGEEEPSEEKIDLPEPKKVADNGMQGMGKPIISTTSILSTLLPPPPTLISETIERYKGNALFKDVFYKEVELPEEGLEGDQIPIQEPDLGEGTFQNLPGSFDEEETFGSDSPKTEERESNQETGSFS